jgi:hypothetical protein
MNLSEIRTLFRESHELRLQITRDIGSFTVSLFALVETKEGERLQLAGTGTLVAAGKAHFILTANHVWEEVLKAASKMGITLTDRIDHHFFIDINTIIPVGPPKQNDWSEWGPDLVFLRVPSEYLGTINAYRSFYDPAVDGRNTLAVDHLQTRVLMGTPEALGRFTPTHAAVEINGYFMPAEFYQTRGDFDYYDFEIDTSPDDIPGSFAGVSGGGLWQVLIYSSQTTGRIDWLRTLEGLAFYQFPSDNSRRTIRCHGPQSIRAMMPSETDL